MDKYNLSMLEHLNKTQYCEFIKYALGLKSFLDNAEYEIRATDSEKDMQTGIQIKSKDKFIAYKYINGKKTNAYIIKPDDFLNKTFSDMWGEKYSVAEYFSSLWDEYIRVVLYGVYGINPDMIRNVNWVPIKGMEIFKINKSPKFDFIIGAGINNGYKLGEWNDLINSMRDEIRAIKGIPFPGSSGTDILKNFEEKMLNTNYIAPQILKDLNPREYEYTLYENLYGKFNPTVTDQKFNSDIENTTLYQLVRIAASQADNCKILTFNYDNVLEMVLNNNFDVSNSTTYRYKHSKRTINPQIEIIHSHGYLPYSEAGRIEPHSIVLSSYEYMEGYERSSAYARRKLNNQLRNTNIIIGNSMTDYEEQKVFFSHHRNYLSDFSYLFTQSSGAGNEWMDYYKLIYYWKMGVIPVYFDSYNPEMIDFLKHI